ncbi:MAG: hypothetical protein PHP08_00250 [Candidatus Dojkabacteria bacterium]|nr:hypothetical protein [Candidatus Dojkabacteria bacterium]
MIEPGRITLELLIGPDTYLYLSYILSPILSTIASWWADQMADESLRKKEKEKNPDVTDEELQNVYEFEHVRQPLIAGLLAGIAVVWTAINQTGLGLEGAAVLSIVSGLTARWYLEKLASIFISKNN